MRFKNLNKAILAVSVVGFVSVTGVLGQDVKGKKPVAVQNPAPVVSTGNGVGVAPGGGVGGASGSGVGAKSGGGVGAASGSGLGTAPSIVILSPSSSIVFRKRAKGVNASDIKLGSGIGSSTGNGVSATQDTTSSGSGEATGNGVGSANDARPAFFNPAPKRDYIKEIDGGCFYVTSQGEKRYVAKAKCVIE